MMARSDRGLPERGHGQAFPTIWPQRGSPSGTMVQLGLAAEAVVVRCCRLPSRFDTGLCLALEAAPGPRQSLSIRQFQGPACRPVCAKTGWSRSALLLQGCNTTFQLDCLDGLALGLQDRSDRLSLVRGDVTGSNRVCHHAYRSHDVLCCLDRGELERDRPSLLYRPYAGQDDFRGPHVAALSRVRDLLQDSFGVALGQLVECECCGISRASRASRSTRTTDLEHTRCRPIRLFVVFRRFDHVTCLRRALN